MDLKNWLLDKGIDPSQVKVYTSSKRKYDKEKTFVKYMTLTKVIEDQEVLIFSATAAKAYNKKVVSLGELQVRYEDDYGYGIVMPLNAIEDELRW